eukprot:TRINITY_DN47570_c0_g1_i1.p2 TRINITY_DN47570_c0_g1~~TRINITY_DN47570_c0_g1_i1.p2  ORF type:complete len:128 (+),score=15.20 TRINITY_DN47570_c0_g1_i1:259-642(+)
MQVEPTLYQLPIGPRRLQRACLSEDRRGEQITSVGEETHSQAFERLPMRPSFSQNGADDVFSEALSGRQSASVDGEACVLAANTCDEPSRPSCSNGFAVDLASIREQMRAAPEGWEVPPTRLVSLTQ